MFEELLAQFGLDRNKLTLDEVATLNNWAQALSNNSLGMRDVVTHVEAMCESIERELCEPPKDIAAWLFRKKNQAHLMARLQNYLMLRDFLTKPERARKHVEAQLSRVAKTAGRI